MSNLNAGKTIDHSVKPTSGMAGIPSLQHGKPYMLPDKKLPNRIKYRAQQLFNLSTGAGLTRVIRVAKPKKVEEYTTNINFTIGRLNENLQ